MSPSFVLSPSGHELTKLCWRTSDGKTLNGSAPDVIETIIFRALSSSPPPPSPTFSLSIHFVAKQARKFLALWKQTTENIQMREIVLKSRRFRAPMGERRWEKTSEWWIIARLVESWLMGRVQGYFRRSLESLRQIAVDCCAGNDSRLNKRADRWNF